jgi:hypothetical protein
MPDEPPPPDQPASADAPAVLTTAANVSGLARETLFSTTGRANVGGLVREILISGIGLGGTIAAKSSGRAAASILSTGVTLAGTIVAQSKSRGATSLSIALAGRIQARASARLAQLPDFVPLAGRIRASSSAQLADLSKRVVQGRASAMSRARGVLDVRYPGPQNAVTLNV